MKARGMSTKFVAGPVAAPMAILPPDPTAEGEAARNMYSMASDITR
jgi:hypothetical protein